MIVRSPHLLSVGKAIVEIAKGLKELQSKNCPYGTEGCTLPRFDAQERKNTSNVDLYETLRVPAKAHSTRWVHCMCCSNLCTTFMMAKCTWYNQRLSLFYSNFWERLFFKWVEFVVGGIMKVRLILIVCITLEFFWRLQKSLIINRTRIFCCCIFS